jgi:Fe2+ or Zn2+ uptake regulation protein
MTAKAHIPPRDDAELSELLRERGLRATSQRVVMHRLLRDRDRHVTAEELLSEASEQLPAVSLPTVYATLELFEQLGIVRRVRRCGRIDDMEIPVDLERARRVAARAGFEPDRAEVVVGGLCRECSAAYRGSG